MKQSDLSHTLALTSVSTENVEARIGQKRGVNSQPCAGRADGRTFGPLRANGGYLKSKGPERGLRLGQGSDLLGAMQTVQPTMKNEQKWPPLIVGRTNRVPVGIFQCPRRCRPGAPRRSLDSRSGPPASSLGACPRNK
jgi:hypothetical protein